MQPIPRDILTQYKDLLKKRAVPVSCHADYRKWLLYYLDFRGKYTLPDSKSEHVRLFIEKLQKKNQTPEQQKQAAHALSLYFEILRKMDMGSRYNEWRCLKKSESPDWDKIIDNLAAEIKTRHYSRKTLKAYAEWGRKFQGFLQNKPTDELSAADVKACLVYLAVECKVSASTQNQAFNALLFLFRHILKKDYGKRSKDRTVPIPQTIMPELMAQFEAIKKLHDEDLAAGFAGVFLEDQLEKIPLAGQL